ncbi:MAG TPA: transposase [Polyangiaceae bacterium]|jgi:REP element-mobilizing transposase RayT|nr:transposase [Polyangiaceae bacterium]
MPRRSHPQTAFEFRTWGGKRKNAGRKPVGRFAGAKHVARPSIDRHAPLHLTMRIARGVPSLRAERLIRLLRHAFHLGRERFGFRLVQYAVQPDHLHLLVEAEDAQALGRGARALSIRIAKRLNHFLGRTGKVFAERYHARSLSSPRQVRNALAYVLLQERRHAAKRRSGLSTKPDSFSSAPLFDGFVATRPRAGPWTGTVVPAATWLLRAGWRRHGKINRAEIPGSLDG